MNVPYKRVHFLDRDTDNFALCKRGIMSTMVQIFHDMKNGMFFLPHENICTMARMYNNHYFIYITLKYFLSFMYP